MSPQIDLDPDIYDYLKSEAEPFMDTPNTVLRRLLHLNEPTTATAPPAPQTRRTQATKAKQKGAKAATTPGRTRAASGTLLPEERYEMPLLRALVDAGGRLPIAMSSTPSVET